MAGVSSNAKLDTVIFELGRGGSEDLQPVLVLVSQLPVGYDDQVGLGFRFRFASFRGVRVELTRFAEKRESQTE